MADDGTKLAAVGGLGLGAGALIATLLRPKPAAPGETIIDGEIRGALANLLAQGEAAASKLDTINVTLTAILAALTGVAGERVLDYFESRGRVLASGEDFFLYRSKPGSGALVWAVVDINSPNATVQFRLDNLQLDFNYNTLLNEGIDRPLFPGVWLARFDAINNHYSLVFSAGKSEGWSFKNMAHIIVRFTGAGTATLTEGRGVAWTV